MVTPFHLLYVSRKFHEKAKAKAGNLKQKFVLVHFFSYVQTSPLISYWTSWGNSASCFASLSGTIFPSFFLIYVVTLEDFRWSCFDMFWPKQMIPVFFCKLACLIYVLSFKQWPLFSLSWSSRHQKVWKENNQNRGCVTWSHNFRNFREGSSLILSKIKGWMFIKSVTKNGRMTNLCLWINAKAC